MIFTVLLLLVLLGCSAQAEVTFLHLGDPQIGYRCNDGIGPENTMPEYAKMTEAQCQERQASQLDAVLGYAEEVGVDFVWVMGDLTEFASYADEQALVRDTFAAHPSLIYKWTAGNHDVLTNNCTQLDRYIINALDDSPEVRRSHWETWTIGKVHFMSINASLMNFDAPACIALSGCSDILDGSSGGCSSDADPDGQSTCNDDEACQDYDGYAFDQMVAVQNWATAFEAARALGDANAIFFGSHHVAWRTTDIQAHPDDFNAIHDMRYCNDGVNVCGAAGHCNDAGLDCDCDDCNGDGSGVTADVARGWRSTIEDRLSVIDNSITTYWLGGHNHTDSEWGPSATVQDGVPYHNFTSLGTGGPATGNDGAPMGARLFHVDDSGTVTWKYIRANGHRVRMN